ncbi:MAG: HvfC/BufC N-terminal domain-containing protein [Gammaproteobacteria bacterium]
MNRLLDVQRHFSDFVWRGQKSDWSGIAPNGIDPEQRLAIYRNNTLLGLTEALRGVYPVIDRLVGEAFFNRLARDFISRHRPKTGCLLSYGVQFPAFLEGFRGVADLPYLADTARLEWCCHEVFHEADAAGLDVAALARVPASAYGELHFSLHPTVRLMESAYPVLRIWQVNQTGVDDDIIELNEGGCRLLVFRSGLDVEVMSLDTNEYRFLSGMRSDLTISEIVAEIVAGNPDFDVTAMLQLCLSKPLLTDFSLV